MRMALVDNVSLLLGAALQCNYHPLLVVVALTCICSQRIKETWATCTWNLQCHAACPISGVTRPQATSPDCLFFFSYGTVYLGFDISFYGLVSSMPCGAFAYTMRLLSLQAWQWLLALDLKCSPTISPFERHVCYFHDIWKRIHSSHLARWCCSLKYEAGYAFAQRANVQFQHF